MKTVPEAKSGCPLPQLMEDEDFGDHAKKSARCPFHEDQHNSSSVYQHDGKWFWKCHAGCGHGDEIDFLGKARGISERDATKLYVEMAEGRNRSTPIAKPSEKKPSSKNSRPFDWQACNDAFTEEHRKRFAESRGYSDVFVSWLHAEGLVGLVQGCVAIPVHDTARTVIGAHVRQDDGSWRYVPSGIKARPLSIGNVSSARIIHVFESQWDAFAVADKLALHEKEDVALIVTRGASNGARVAGLIPERSKCYCWTQNDAPGEDWERDICANTKATVKRAKIPAQFKDLNDWTRDGAQSAELVAAITNSEVLRQLEKSWTVALNESVVTSNVLHNLELKPRKKLLGDWFCEGDLGFTFAFRGVGKTWLALAIAGALSEGGKIGEWQASERVKVLYIDGEMPPDLMRDRCDGLQGSNDQLEFLNHEILFDRTEKALNITNRDVQQAITQRCVRTGVKVVILDNLSTLASGMKENDADAWELVNNWLLDLRRRKIAVIIVHHAGRSGEMRGTSKREDNVFWIIALDDAKKNADDKRGAGFISRFTKPSRNTQEEVPPIEWHFVTDPATDVVSISHKQAQTLDVFRKCIEEGVTECSQLAQELKVTPGTISKWAKKAIDAGWLKKEGRQYELINDAESPKTVILISVFVSVRFQFPRLHTGNAKRSVFFEGHYL